MSEPIPSQNIITIENLSFGDVINAKRNSDIKKLDGIPTGHKIGPYVVIGHKNGNIICFYATSVRPKTEILKEYTISIPEDSIRFTKKTYIDLHRVITILKKDIVGYRCTLTIEEKNMLSRKIEVLKRRGVYALRYINPNILPIEIGDIISLDNNLYLVININKKSYQVLSLKKEPDNNHLSKITINNTIYFCNINDITSINKKSNITRIDSIENKTILERLQNIIREYQLAKKELITPKIGSIIELKDLLFLIFSEDEFTYSTYCAYKQNTENFLPLLINGQPYYLDLSKIIKISKNVAKNKAIAQSSNSEINNIPIPNDSTPILGFTEYINKFKMGDIVINTSNGIEYIVISSFLDVIVILNKDEINSNTFHPIVTNPENFHLNSSLDKISFKELLSRVKETVNCNLNSEEIYKLKKEPTNKND